MSIWGGNDIWGFHTCAVWSPEAVSTWSCVGWKRSELTEPLCPTYCNKHVPFSPHQIRAVWSTNWETCIERWSTQTWSRDHHHTQEVDGTVASLLPLFLHYIFTVHSTMKRVWHSGVIYESSHIWHMLENKWRFDHGIKITRNSNTKFKSFTRWHPHCLGVQKVQILFHKVGFQCPTSWYPHNWTCIHRKTNTICRSPPPPKILGQKAKSNH